MSTPASKPSSIVERDPVCGMNIDPATAKHLHEHNSKNYYFCCAACLLKFKADPAKYLSPKPSGLVTLGAAIAKPPAKLAAQTQPPAYVCPMCPEVREYKPGACPSCGMALEPELPL